MTDHSPLIAEARALPKGDPGDQIDSLVQRLADALARTEIIPLKSQAGDR